MKDHQIAEIVNSLRDAAVTHHASGQLRERLRSCIEPLLLAIVPPVAAGSADRPKLHDMTLADTETRDWYFDCDDHYIDVELRKDGHYSIYFRNRADGGEGRLDTGVLTERAEKAEAEVLLLRQDRENLSKLATSRREWAEKAEARVKELEAQLARRHAPLSPEVQQAIAAARAAGQTIEATLGGLVFLNGGTGPGEGELDCPACGGSGHAGDVVAGGAA